MKLSLHLFYCLFLMPHYVTLTELTVQSLDFRYTMMEMLIYSIYCGDPDSYRATLLLLHRREFIMIDYWMKLNGFASAFFSPGKKLMQLKRG